MRRSYLYRLLKIPRSIQQKLSYWLISPIVKSGWGRFGKGSYICPPFYVANRNNLYLGDNVRLMGHCDFLNVKGKLTFGNGSGASSNLTIITDNHLPKPGETYYGSNPNVNLESGDVIIGEDVWIGVNVTILPNVQVGRGAIVGAGTVLRGQKIPPYAIVVGNPAKIVGFRFTPDEVMQHEGKLYKEQDRLPISKIEQNYEKYFLSRILEIKYFVKL